MTIPSTRQRVLLGVAAGGLTAVLAACGSSSSGSGGTATAPPPPKSGTSASQVTAELSDFHIKLSTEKFTAGTYTFTAKNTGHHEHALVVQGPGGANRSKTVSPGESTALTVTLKSGTYQIYCPIDGHKDLGMKTGITVGGAPAPSTNKPSNNDQSPGNGY
ncbi:copper-binding protein [Streptomyces sp. MS06]|uniref:copper-binding protein n=1 Tax=Streptomyces sp. MS06 TaxID=3385974 RepID=UPI00399FFB0C